MKRPDPPTVLKAREALTSHDMEITGENLKHLIDSKDMNLLAVAFRKSMCEASKKAYNELANGDAKREWLAQFVIDPQFATATGWNTTEVGLKEMTKKRIVWVTEEQLADILKSEKHAGIMKADLPDRPHESPSMAKHGILQYEYQCTEQEFQNFKKETAGTKLEAELNAAEHARITNDLKNVKVGTTAGLRKPIPKQAKPKVEKHRSRWRRRRPAQRRARHSARPR